MGLIIFLFFLLIVLAVIWKTMHNSRFFMNSEGKIMKKSMNIGIILAVLIVLILVAIISSGIVIVQPGEMVVKFNKFSSKGNLSTLGQGFHVIIPFIYTLTKYNMKIQEYTMSVAHNEGQIKGDDSVWSPTKEGLQVGVDVTLWFKLDPSRLIELHKTIGKDYVEKIVRPAVRSIIRNTVSQYKVMELYSLKRAEVQQKLYDNVKKEVAPHGIVVVKLLLRDIAFPKDFQRAIEEKQIAEQQAQKMEYVLEKERKEAERKKIEANGEATKINIINEALRKNPNYIKYLYVEKLSKNVKVIVSDQSTIMDLKGLIEK